MANPMSDALRQELYGGRTDEELRGANEQMGDIDFAMDVGSKLGYNTRIDPAKARAHLSWPNIDLQGYTIAKGRVPDPASYTYLNENSGQMEQLPTEEDTVNVVSPEVAANQETWPHEYLHDLYPGVSEGAVRFLSAFNAREEAPWREAVEHYRKNENYKWGEFKKPLSFAEAERELAETITSGGAVNPELANSEHASIRRDAKLEARSYGRALDTQLKDEYAQGKRAPDTGAGRDGYGRYKDWRAGQGYWSKALRNK